MPARRPTVEPSVTETPEFTYESGLIEFDLDSSFVDPASAKTHENSSLDPQDPLFTKLSLAEEFNAIGDADGARALVEEVIAEASGALKVRAQQLLSQLG